jgi:hypothetical protein
MKYQLLNDPVMQEPSNTVCRINDDLTRSFIPFDFTNTDYAAYLEWVEAGNAPEPAPIPVDPAPLTPAERLAASGLTVAELKSLLGLA